MLEVTVGELRRHLPEYLGRAESGDEFLVTRRGRVVARLTAAPDARAAAKERLAALRTRARVGDVVTSIDATWNAAE
ncbi:type II toxin-antitoxin system prevent-host-death family antitoxin [uncultured Thiodictyon sp.]|uniref:type II toxin-antitoxin system Phd/YefM family antitoxin n=1 Tax=uncultured Thiodictyon sp. TaxID=1846217 RepID=UPI0025DC20E6|nr:type II toxin-antitoxin system prevent-host-death family antitoxin [uncultured Thiodictyon sp.]